MAKDYYQEDTEMHMEDLEVGDKFTTLPRTIASEEIKQFAVSINDPLPQFLSREGAVQMGFKEQVVPGYLTLSLASGLRHESGLTSHVLAFMAMDKMRLLAPVYAGDSIRVEHELLSKKPTKKPGRVVCVYRWRILNQDKVAVAEGENT